MSADPYNSVPENAEELAKLQSGLRGSADDESMLSEVGMAMRSLLSGNGDSEDRIRAMLKEEFAAGHLREETYELVQTPWVRSSLKNWFVLRYRRLHPSAMSFSERRQSLRNRRKPRKQ